MTIYDLDVSFVKFLGVFVFDKLSLVVNYLKLRKTKEMMLTTKGLIKQLIVKMEIMLCCKKFLLTESIKKIFWKNMLFV